MPEKLGEVTAARIDTKIFVIGEHTKRSKNNGKTFIYDILKDEWSMGEKRIYAGNHSPGVVYGGRWIEGWAAAYRCVGYFACLTLLLEKCLSFLHCSATFHAI